MKTSLVIVVTAIVLLAVSALAIMNNACKWSQLGGALQYLPYGIT
jgi:hypothetical protein